MTGEEECPAPAGAGIEIADDTCNNISSVDDINLSPDTDESDTVELRSLIALLEIVITDPEVMEEIGDDEDLNEIIFCLWGLLVDVELELIPEPEIEPKFVKAYEQYAKEHPEHFPPDEPLGKKHQIYKMIRHCERIKKLEGLDSDEEKNGLKVFNSTIQARVAKEYTNRGGREKHFVIDAIGVIKKVNLYAVSLLVHHVLRSVSFNKTIYFYDDEGGVYREDKGHIAAAVRVFCEIENMHEIHNALVGAVTGQILSFKVFTEYPFNQRRNIIPVKNGTLHVTSDINGYTFERRDKSHFDMVTWRIPIEYDILAAVHKQKVLDLFDEWVGVEKAPTLIRIPAQAVRQAALELPFKRSYLLVGAKDAGKTSYLNLLYREFDRLFSQVALQLVGAQFKTGEMEGKLLNIKDELSDTEMKNLNEFKDFTGSTRHLIERKGKDGYPGRIACGHVFACNTPPKLSNPNDAPLLSRWEIVIFPNIFDRVPGWFESTINEDFLKAFLLLIIEEVTNLIETGVLPEVDEDEVRDIWTKKASPEESTFIQDVLLWDSDGLIECDRCVELYTRYMGAKGKKAKTKENFGKALHNLGVYRSRPRIAGKRPYCYTGIREKGSFIKPDKNPGSEQTEVT